MLSLNNKDYYYYVQSSGFRGEEYFSYIIRLDGQPIYKPTDLDIKSIILKAYVCYSEVVRQT
jgi:hypothetical protein